MKRLIGTFAAYVFDSETRIWAGMLGLFLMGVLASSAIVHAATKGDPLPRATFGAVAVATASATQIFTTTTLQVGRNAFAVYNNGPNTIWCGWKSNVTTATGYPVPASSSLSVDLVANTTSDANFYCIASTALQVSPADTRWIQVK